MFRKLATAAAFMGAIACSSAEEDAAPDPMVDAGVDQPDTGLAPLDTGVVFPRPDVGFPDAGFPDVGYPDAAPRPDAGPPPPDEVEVYGRVLRLGAYLGGETVYEPQTPILAFGVVGASPVNANANAEYSITLPANGQAVMVTAKAGFNQTFETITTGTMRDQRNLYVAEPGYLQTLATDYGVGDLGPTRPCQTNYLLQQNPDAQCYYAAILGSIQDDGTAGNGVVRPVAGVSRDDFTIYGPNNEDWYVRGPYFLDYTGTSSVGAQTSIVYNDNGDYRGGLYVVFVEVPSRGDIATSFRISVAYPDQGVTRYFGPVSTQGFRSPGGSVTRTNLPETGAPPPPPVDGIDFDTQIYPLFLAVAEGGLGCVGCHTNQGGADPAGGMNLYGGAVEAYASLDPNQYPQRVNTANPAASYLLVRPLYEANGIQDHPIFAFTSEQDPGYQLIYTWITEGGLRDNNNLPPVSFYNDVRPLLYNATTNGGLGCRTCHVDAVRGGFDMGGDGNALYDALVNQRPTNPGPDNEPYRINKQGYPERSLVLTNPLYNNNEPHPVKIFADNADARYQLIYRWIAEGYINDTP